MPQTSKYQAEREEAEGAEHEQAPQRPDERLLSMKHDKTSAAKLRLQGLSSLSYSSNVDFTQLLLAVSNRDVLGLVCTWQIDEHNLDMSIV